MVETALILPLLILLLLVIVDLGRVTYTFSALHNAVREGARYAVVDCNWTDEEDVEAYTIERAIGVSHDPAVLTVLVNFDLPPASPTTVTVNATYDFQTASPVLWLLTGNSTYTLETSSTMILEFLEGCDA